MVERGLRAAGYRTGRYTSPHLVHLEERFVIDGRPIETSGLETLAARVREAAEALPLPPTFFEATTAAALEAFRDARVDVAVLEVGMGGRLDATNAVDSTAVAITSVDFDHEAYLGHTLEAIATEKAGVIKSGGLVVLAANPPVVQDIVRSTAEARGAEFVYAPEGVLAAVEVHDGRTRLAIGTRGGLAGMVDLALRGRHQADNAITAVRLLEELDRRGDWPVPASAIWTALSDVTWPGRLELLRWQGQDVLIDGAHNPAGARALASYLCETYGRPVPIVLGMMRDKQIGAIIEALAPAASHLVFTSPASHRAATPVELAAIARSVAPAVATREVAEPVEALTAALSLGEPAVVAGSLYLAGEIRAKIV
jgi:dihydrofolate synthase / folylpolyglutamate synthase